MPKIGSQTVEASLRQCGLPHQIVRCHYLSPARIAELRGVLRNGAGSNEWREQLREQIVLMTRVSAALRLRHFLRLCRFKVPKLQIITAVREPIELGLSSVFQNYLYFASSPEELTQARCAEVLQRPKMFLSLEGWFENELTPIAGLDVFQAPFDHRRGYGIYENSRARVLVYRFDALRQLGTMVREFLGCELPGMVNRNLGQEKLYSEHYDSIKKTLRLPAEFVMRRYSSKLANHFFSPQEIAGFVRRWSEANLHGIALAETGFARGAGLAPNGTVENQ